MVSPFPNTVILSIINPSPPYLHIHIYQIQKQHALHTSALTAPGMIDSSLPLSLLAAAVCTLRFTFERLSAAPGSKWPSFTTESSVYPSDRREELYSFPREPASVEPRKRGKWRAKKGVREGTEAHTMATLHSIPDHMNPAETEGALVYAVGGGGEGRGTCWVFDAGIGEV